MLAYYSLNPYCLLGLVRRVIKLSGMDVMDEQGNGDIEIQYSGLRPGEKLYEELLIGENVDGTDHPRIMTAHEDFIPYAQLTEAYIELEAKLENYDYDAVLVLLKQLVHGFNHTSGIVDYLYTKDNVIQLNEKMK